MKHDRNSAGAPRRGRWWKVVALAAALTVATATPALAHHHRDAGDTSTYWRWGSESPVSMQVSTGGLVSSAAVRELRGSQWYMTTIDPWAAGYGFGEWNFQTSAYVGDVQAWMTCSGKMTALDAYYSSFNIQGYINQNAYCNAWITIDSGEQAAHVLYLDNVSGGWYTGRNVGWDAVRRYT